MQYCFVQTTECWFFWCLMIKNSLFYDINLHKLTVDLLVKTSWHWRWLYSRRDFNNKSLNVSVWLGVEASVNWDKQRWLLSSSSWRWKGKSHPRTPAWGRSACSWSSLWADGCGRAGHRAHRSDIWGGCPQSGGSGAPERCPGSQTCRRSACRALWSWCSCRSSSAGRGSACHSSCWVCSCAHPSAWPLRPGRSS